VRLPQGRMLLLLLLLGAVSLRGRAALGADQFTPYFVATDDAQLFDGRSLVPMKLIPGELVLAKPHDTYRDWLIVIYGGKQFSSDSKYYMSAVRTRTNLQREIAELQHEIDTLSDRIADALNKANELFAAESGIRFDYAVQYKIRTLVPVAPAQGTAGDGTGRHPGRGRPPAAPRLEVQYRYEDKISSGASRNQASRWEDDRDELEDEADRLMEKRRDRTKDLAETQAELAHAERQLAAFRDAPENYLTHAYITARDNVRLYDGKRATYELEPDVVMLGARNREHQDWLRVRYRDGIYDVKADRLLSRFELEFRRRRDGLNRKIADLMTENQVLEARIDVIDSLQLAVDYESRLYRVPLRSNPWEGTFRGNRYYSSRSCPEDAVEVVNRSRARRLWREWDGLLEDMRDKRDDNRRKLLELRRDLAGIEPQFQDKIQRLKAVEQSVKGGPRTADGIDW
jgi:predicted  nucleic acid-binding Zn-ribbon protein